jgi:cysteinyl-tRNA synthetase
MADVPDDVRRLAEERDERRRARDFAAADELRARIAGLGYRVVDTAAGSSVEAAPAPAVERMRPQDVPSVLDVVPRYDASLHWLLEGWPQDLRRALDAFRASVDPRSVQFVVTDVAEEAPASFGDDVEVLPLAPGTGWATACNAGLRRSLGSIVVVLDGSVEPTGDVLGPLHDALADPTVGVCGPFGIVTSDLRTFEPSAGPNVDAIEGYLMAFRRDVIASTGGFDERFRWYRTADVELSFRIKDLGLRAVVVEVPVRRHEHRTWVAAGDQERARLSKRNFNTFLDRFRGRLDLTVAGGRSD